MIKKLFIVCDVIAAASFITSISAYAQAPTPVTCVSGCINTGVTGTTVEIADGTNGPAAVKAASTAPTATDKALVVAISPNSVNANGQATMANSAPVALASNQSVADPCMFTAKSNLAVSVQTAISVQLVALSTGTTIYVCSLSLIGSTATVFSITTGTGTACATSTAAVFGTATATNGISLATNGGLTLGNGGGTVGLGASGAELCLIQSGGGTLAGNLTYVQK